MTEVWHWVKQIYEIEMAQYMGTSVPKKYQGPRSIMEYIGRDREAELKMYD